ncbi:MAG: peptide deformylase [Candidatus Pacebacteria bacterium]|nr:peptide deformylase [Candidatus Paceibacterota bacterium]
MEIITAPHPTLRLVANRVEKFDKRLLKFVARLEKQLLRQKNPEGVGLAAPQVNKSWQIFIMRHVQEQQDQHDQHQEKNQDRLTAFINPIIIDHSQNKTLLKAPEHFEGCLSVPEIYGPVPRWEWVTIKYQSLDSAGKVEERTEKYQGFLARIIQHEYDHLQGVLFTDHLLEQDLPAYIMEKDQWVELEDRTILSKF